jgi:hypothetical protein
LIPQDKISLLCSVTSFLNFLSSSLLWAFTFYRLNYILSP